jgi:hypothetical protein
MGVYLFASTNPSGVAIAEIAAFWIAALTFVEGAAKRGMVVRDARWRGRSSPAKGSSISRDGFSPPSAALVERSWPFAALWPSASARRRARSG